MASPDPKRQQQEQQQQAPPEYKPFEEEQEKTRENIHDKNYKKIEEKLNNFKNGFYEYLKNKFPSSYQDNPYANFQIRQALGSIEALNHHLWEYMSLYRGEFVGFYLGEASMELLYSALGPIGNMWRLAKRKELNWKMAWAKNLLNPNAIYYYFHSLPQQEAFKLLRQPVTKAFSILAKGGAPFVSKVHTMEYNQEGKEQVKTSYVFSPVYRLTQFNHNLVNSFNVKAGVREPDQVNEILNGLLHDFDRAKTKQEKTAIGAKLQQELFKIDGSIFKRALANAARRLGDYQRDPITNLLSFIIGGLVDFTIGAIVNGVKILAIRAASFIPGFTMLRGRMINFLTSSPILNTARIGGISIRSFARGVFSPTTLASGYLGYRFGDLISQAVGLINPSLTATLHPFLTAGFTAGSVGLGAFYKTSLNLAQYGLREYGYSISSGWVQRIQALERIAHNPAMPLAQREIALNELKSISLKGFKPGPFTRFGSWLYQRPFARLPINGLAVADLGVRFLGWNPWIAYPSFIAADWLWQVKGPLFDKFMNKWLQPTWKIFKWQTPSFHARFQNLSMRINRFYWEKIAHVWQPGNLSFAERGWFKYANQAIKIGRPFAQNFFNPGFFMGFGISQYLIGLGWNPIAAYFVGPIAGSIGWNLGARALTSIFPKAFSSMAAGMARINAAGWSGYLVGTLLDIFIPGSQAWLGPILSGGFVIGDIILSLAGKSLIQLIASGVGSIVTFFSGISAGAAAASATMAIWATATSIALVASLTVFFAYTIYAGFWVPMIEEAKAGPQSNNFTIKNNCAQTGPNQYECCSNFSVTENIFNTLHHLDHKTDFSNTELSVDLTNLSETSPTNNAVEAFRNATQLNYFHAYLNLNKDQFGVNPSGSIVYGTGTGLAAVLTYLTTPDDQLTNLKELMATNRSVVYSMKPFFDILTALAKEHTGTKHLVTEYQAQLKLFETQKELVDALINNISAGSLSQALQAANRYLNRNPLTDPCPGETDCPPEKQGLKSLYDSWEPKITRYITTITNLLAQTDPNLDNFLAQLEQEQTGLQQQIDLLPGIIDQMKEIQKKMTDADAAIINDPGFSFYNFSDEVWRLLSTYFKDIFNENDKFFFVPQGTNYRVCMDMTYTGTLPAEPQSVCSTISYQPSIWGPNTSFAKACTTFTPQ